MRVFNGVTVFLSLYMQEILHVLENNVIYPGLLSCFRVDISDDIFLRQWTFCLLFVIA